MDPQTPEQPTENQVPSPAPPAEVPPAAPPQPVPPARTPVASPTGSSKKPILIVVAVLVLLAIIATVVILLGKSDKTPAADTNNSTATTTTDAENQASINSHADDAKRKADLSALQTQLEAYFAQNGRYPTLADVNDATWRQANMPSLQAGALQDPAASSAMLSAAPQKGSYSYEPKDNSGGACDDKTADCVSYKLTAYLSDGTTITKVNLD